MSDRHLSPYALRKVKRLHQLALEAAEELRTHPSPVIRKWASAQRQKINNILTDLGVQDEDKTKRAEHENQSPPDSVA